MSIACGARNVLGLLAEMFLAEIPDRKIALIGNPTNLKGFSNELPPIPLSSHVQGICAASTVAYNYVCILQYSTFYMVACMARSRSRIG